MMEGGITEVIIGCAIRVHRGLGPGLLESAYEACLFYELCKTELKVERQKPLPLVYDEVKLDCGYRLDLLLFTKQDETHWLITFADGYDEKVKIGSCEFAIGEIYRKVFLE